jgi:RNA recognition motif-containing protein
MGRLLWAREDRETLASSAGVDDSIKINSTSSLTPHPTLTTITNHNHTNYPNTNNTTNSSAAQSRRVYVGNLSWDVAWQDLKDHMRQVGDVLFAEVMTEANTGRSKGCGIVEFHTSEDAQRAIRTLNDTELKGRMIFVREDREGPQQHASHSTTNTTPLTGSSTIPSSTNIHHAPSAEAAVTHTLHPIRSDDSPTTSLFISNIPWNTTWYQLKDFISTTTTAGAVTNSTSTTTTNYPVLPEHVQIVSLKGGRTPYAIVRYGTTQDAQYAKEALQGVKFMSKTLEVRFDRQSQRSK